MSASGEKRIADTAPLQFQPATEASSELRRRRCSLAALAACKLRQQVSMARRSSAGASGGTGMAASLDLVHHEKDRTRPQAANPLLVSPA
jgi:hypothetical protein